MASLKLSRVKAQMRRRRRFQKSIAKGRKKATTAQPPPTRKHAVPTVSRTAPPDLASPLWASGVLQRYVKPPPAEKPISAINSATVNNDACLLCAGIVLPKPKA